MNTQAIPTRIFVEGESLARFVMENIPKLEERSIVVVTSKIVSLSEGRTANYVSVKAKVALIKQESTYMVATKLAWLTIKDGILMPNAGIDESNGNGKLILHPKDAMRSARLLRAKLKKHCQLRQLGIIISDSYPFPLRAGVVGLSVGYAGFKGIRDYRGKRDLFGRKFSMTRVDIVDSIAAGAVLLMGEGGESRPLAVVQDAPVEFTERVPPHELRIPLEEDLYGPLFKHRPK